MGKKKRRSAAVKEEVVLRLLKGEDLELVSRDTGFGLHELTAWRDRYLRGGREALKSHPGDPAIAQWRLGNGSGRSRLFNNFSSLDASVKSSRRPDF